MLDVKLEAVALLERIVQVGGGDVLERRCVCVCVWCACICVIYWMYIYTILCVHA